MAHGVQPFSGFAAPPASPQRLSFPPPSGRAGLPLPLPHALQPLVGLGFAQFPPAAAAGGLAHPLPLPQSMPSPRSQAHPLAAGPISAPEQWHQPLVRSHAPVIGPPRYPTAAPVSRPTFAAAARQPLSVLTGAPNNSLFNWEIEVPVTGDARSSQPGARTTATLVPVGRANTFLAVPDRRVPQPPSPHTPSPLPPISPAAVSDGGVSVHSQPDEVTCSTPPDSPRRGVKVTVRPFDPDTPPRREPAPAPISLQPQASSNPSSTTATPSRTAYDQLNASSASDTSNSDDSFQSPDPTRVRSATHAQTVGGSPHPHPPLTPSRILVFGSPTGREVGFTSPPTPMRLPPFHHREFKSPQQSEHRVSAVPHSPMRLPPAGPAFGPPRARIAVPPSPLKADPQRAQRVEAAWKKAHSELLAAAASAGTPVSGHGDGKVSGSAYANAHAAGPAAAAAVSALARRLSAQSSGLDAFVRARVCLFAANVATRAGDDSRTIRSWYVKAETAAPLDPEVWCRHAMFEDELGNVQFAAEVAACGVTHCGVGLQSELQALRAVKAFERQSNLTSARALLSAVQLHSAHSGQPLPVRSDQRRADTPLHSIGGWRLVFEGAKMEARAGRVTVAYQVLKYLMERLPATGVLYVEIAKLCLERLHDTQRAIRYVDEGLQALTTYAPLYMTSLRIRHALGQHKTLLSVLASARKNLPKEFAHKIYLMLAALEETQAITYTRAYGSGDLRAIEHAQHTRSWLVSAVQTSPRNVRWKIWIAGCRLEGFLEHWNAVEKLVRRACVDIELHADELQSHAEAPIRSPVMRAPKALRTAKDAAAAAAAQELSPLGMKSRPLLLLEIARLLQFAGRLRLAGMVLRIAKRRHPNQWKVHLQLVLYHLYTHNFVAAKRDLRVALAAHPTNGRLWALHVSLAHALPDAMADADPLATLRLALKSVPKSGEVWCEGAKLYLDPALPCFNLKAARECLEFAITLTPQFFDSYVEFLRLKLLVSGPAAVVNPNDSAADGAGQTPLQRVTQMALASEEGSLYGPMWQRLRPPFVAPHAHAGEGKGAAASAAGSGSGASASGSGGGASVPLGATDHAAATAARLQRAMELASQELQQNASAYQRAMVRGMSGAARAVADDAKSDDRVVVANDLHAVRLVYPHLLRLSVAERFDLLFDCEALLS